MAKLSIQINNQDPIIMGVDEADGMLSTHIGLLDEDVRLMADGHFSTPEAVTHLYWIKQLKLSTSDSVTIKRVGEDTATTEPKKVSVNPKTICMNLCYIMVSIL